MSQSNGKITLEKSIREYLDFSQDLKEAEIFAILENYVNVLFEGEEEEILLEDFSAYEADDFIHFFLEEEYSGQEKEDLQKRSVILFKKWTQFLNKKKYLHKEAVDEWKEVLK